MECPPAHTVLCSSCSRRPTESPLIKRVPRAAKWPTDKDFVVVCSLLVLVRYRRPFLLFNLCHRLQLCPHLYNVRSVRIAPDPGSLHDLKHVIAVANGDRNYSRLATVTERLSSTDIADASQDDFFALSIFRAGGGNPLFADSATRQQQPKNPSNRGTQ